MGTIHVSRGNKLGSRGSTKEGIIQTSKTTDPFIYCQPSQKSSNMFYLNKLANIVLLITFLNIWVYEKHSTEHAALELLLNFTRTR